MKRFSRIFSGIAAIMLGVGIILIAIGFGRAKADWEKLREENQGHGQVEREFAGIGNIDLKIPFGYIKVGTATDGKVHFRAVNVNENLLVDEGSGELRIRMAGEKNMVQNFSTLLMGLNFDQDEFIIQEYELLLPGDYSGKMKIDVGGGKLDIDGVRAGEVRISMDLGELRVRGCDIGRLDAGCDIGETKVDGHFRELSVKNDIGAVDVNMYGDKEDYKGTVHCGIGKLGHYNYSRADVTNLWHWEGGFGIHEKWEGRHAAGKLEVRCDIGEVSVMFSGRIPDAAAEVSQDLQDNGAYGLQDGVAEASDGVTGDAFVQEDKTYGTAGIIPEETGTDTGWIWQDETEN